LNQADYCVSYGGKITSLLNGIGIPTSKIVVIPGAVSDSTLLEKRALPINNKFLFVGRYERRKGIEELMQVVASMPNLEISFVGALPPSKKIKRANVHYYGEVKDVSTLNKIFDEHTFLISPSHSEGMPNVILEGMSRGLIPIATNVGAVAELVNDSNGFFIEPKNTASICMCIEKVVAMDKDQITILSTNAIDKIKSTFTWSSIIRLTIENFQRVIEKP
jgi:glycosyltransferase involved in cell wall biosynthesis